VNLRRRCLCGKRKNGRPIVIRDCGSHAQAAVDLALALRDRYREEQRFWKALEGRTCCGTMDNCPLA
jgi:hypothetical protein